MVLRGPEKAVKSVGYSRKESQMSDLTRILRNLVSRGEKGSGYALGGGGLGLLLLIVLLVLILR